MTEDYLAKLLKREGVFLGDEQSPRDVSWEGRSIRTNRIRNFGNIALLYCPTEHRYFITQQASRHRYTQEITKDTDVLDIELELFNEKGEPYLSSSFTDDEAEMVRYWIDQVLNAPKVMADLSHIANYGRF